MTDQPWGRTKLRKGRTSRLDEQAQLVREAAAKLKRDFEKRDHERRARSAEQAHKGVLSRAESNLGKH